ncbi:MAG: hypothetical protein CM1200mP2_22730 [Planctomycetaceae bacterium]|nr:MAG: hypothetical protein CM1200mP2_22730 [Planctomycetaceae bacterium]
MSHQENAGPFLDRKTQGNPVRVGVVGAGKFGTMFLAQARTTLGLGLSAVVDLDPARAADSLVRVGWPAEQIVPVSTAGELVDVVSRGRVGVTTDVGVVLESGIDVLVESTGHVAAAARHVMAAVDAGVHVVMVTVEADVLVGPRRWHDGPPKPEWFTRWPTAISRR